MHNILLQVYHSSYWYVLRQTYLYKLAKTGTFLYLNIALFYILKNWINILSCQRHFNKLYPKM